MTMVGTIYWISVFVIILVIFLIALIVKHAKHDADMWDTVVLAVVVVLIIAFGMPLILSINHIHTPLKVIITDMDGKVTVYETERGYVDDNKDYWRIYDKDSDDWSEHHNFKSAQIEYLEK